MDKAKAAVSNFMSKAGHHDTTVHEKVAPAVTEHTVSPRRHEETTTAVDREVHQDHYHTSVQPVQDREILPEKHHHNMAPVEHREHHHGNESDIKARLEQEAARLKDKTHTNETKYTSSTTPVVGGEHIHHHVHETIQPVVQKETIQPSVVHTTVPIHEVHHNEAKHHSASALPAVSMADFKKHGGVLGGREERVDGFEGEPRAVSGTGSTGTSGITGSHHHTTGSGLTGSHHNTTGLNDRGYDETERTGGSGLTGHHGTTGSGLTGSHHNTTGQNDRGYDDTGRTGTTGTSGLTGHHGTTGTTGNSGLSGNDYDTTGRTGTHGTTGGLSGNKYDSTGTTGKTKPSLADKLNPKIDADGDGKAGFMS